VIRWLPRRSVVAMKTSRRVKCTGRRYRARRNDDRVGHAPAGASQREGAVAPAVTPEAQPSRSVARARHFLITAHPATSRTGPPVIHPRRDLTIALVLLLVSMPTLLAGLPAMRRNESSWLVGIAVVAGLVAFFSAFMTWNFYNALRLARRLERGEHVVARWTVSGESMASFRREEQQRARNHWRPRVDTPVEVIVGQEAVLVGGLLYSTPTAGLQAVCSVRLLHSDPPVLEFATTLVAATGSPSSRSLGVSHGALRLPAPERRAAALVVQHFTDMLAGRTIVAPTRWTVRIWIGVAGMVLAAAAGIGGYLGAEANGWRGDAPLWWIPLVLMITAPLLALASLALTVTAAIWRRQQRGR